jgi:DNA-binding IclR family transcriptional regulator
MPDHKPDAIVGGAGYGSGIRKTGEDRAMALRSLRDALTEEQIAGDSGALPPQVIKSAGRALQILELFDVLQRRATVMEVAELLGYPQSSTTMLLRSLVAMGYLNYDRRARTYITSSRVALLGKWAATTLVGDGSLTHVMRRINERTGQSVVLAARYGLMARYIHVVQATAAVRLFVVQGSVRPLIRSGTGYALLASLPDPDIMRVVMRVNAEGGVNGEMVKQADVLAQVREVREKGYAFTIGLLTPDAGVLAMPLPAWLAREADQPAVIGIGAAASVLNERLEELVEILREELAREPLAPLNENDDQVLDVSLLKAAAG